MKHTPGPWEMSQNIIGGYNIRFDKGKRKAYETVGDIRKKENAQLVIAAPEMYNLLYSLKELVSVANEEIIDEVLTKVEGGGGE